MNITAEQVKEYRDQYGMGLKEARKELENIEYIKQLSAADTIEEKVRVLTLIILNNMGTG